MAETWPDHHLKHCWSPPVCLLGIVAIGSFFRLWDLGETAWRADEGFFWDIFLMKLTPGQVFGKWMELQGLSGQFPFNAAFSKWFVDVLGLPVSPFTVRLPSAVWGILTILAAYGTGRELAGRGFGLILAAVLALNPYHIQVSREAYHYAPMVCGAFLGLWTALWLIEHFEKGKPVTPLFHVVNITGFFLMTYAQPSGWPIAFLVVVVVLYGSVRQWLKTHRVSATCAISLGAYAVVSIPMLVAPWGLKQQMDSASAEMKAHLVRIFGSGDPFFDALWRALTSYAWGDTFLRGAFTAIVLGLGLWICIRRLRSDRRYLVLTGFLVLGFGFAMASMYSTGRPFASRYVIAMQPMYLTLLAVGLTFSAELVRSASAKNRDKIQSLLPGSLFAVSTLLWVPAAYYSTQLTGLPTPYRQITSWMDANLQRGTLVLVDRWFEPWNEFRIEPATNVVLTFTIPDEPLDVFVKNRWRDTAVNFFARYPDSAYLEITKHYFEVPSVGPWEWPRQFFSRHVVFTNEAGLKLRNIGQAARGDFYLSTTNRVIVDLFYNTRDDVLQKARAAQQPFMAFYGTGWSYTKTQDHRDWRLLQGAAQIDVHNLTDQSKTAFLAIHAVALGAAKQVNAAPGFANTFPANQISQWRLGPLTLPPGKTIVQLTDDHWEKARVPLLVEGVAVQAGASAPGERNTPSR